MKKITLTATLLLVGGMYFANAQVGIGTTEPHASALLHIEAKDKGVLIPNVRLTALDAELPVGSPAESLLVYNTTIDTEKKLSPGFYFWSGGKWNRISDATNINTLIDEYFTENTTNIENIVKDKESKTVVVEVKDEEGNLTGYNYFSEKAIQDGVALNATATADNGVYYIDVATIVENLLDFDPENPGDTNTIIEELKEIIKAMESKTVIVEIKDADNKLTGYYYINETAIAAGVTAENVQGTESGVYKIDVSQIVENFLDFDPTNPGEDNTVIEKLKEIIKAMESKTVIVEIKDADNKLTGYYYINETAIAAGVTAENVQGTEPGVYKIDVSQIVENFLDFDPTNPGEDNTVIEKLKKIIKAMESKTVIVKVHQDNDSSKELLGYKYFNEEAIAALGENETPSPETPVGNGVFFIEIKDIVNAENITNIINQNVDSIFNNQLIKEKIEKIVLESESQTNIVKVEEGSKSTGDISVKYEYLNEAYRQEPGEDKKEIIDLTTDIKNLIEGNTTIQQSITNTINNSANGSNVYYGKINDTDENEVLYRITEDGDKIEIDFLSNPEIINKIKEIVNVNYNIENGDNVVITTNNKWINGKELKVWAKIHNQPTASANFDVAGAPATMNTIAKVTVISENGQNILSSFQKVRKEGGSFKFTTGMGLFSSVVEAGNYIVLVEFTE